MEKRTKFEENKTGPQGSVVSEFIQFLKQNKKYWLIPILLALLAIGVLVILGGTSAAPFIYTLF